jgi:hypothetical protein
MWQSLKRFCAIFSVGFICFAFIWLGQPQAIDLIPPAALQ